MIIFENEDKVFTELAQSYIEVFFNIIDDESEDYQDKLESIQSFFPNLVYLENPDKCMLTFLKIQEWAKDNFFHKLGSLEKYAIIKIFDTIDEELITFSPEDFCSIYFEKSLEEIMSILKEYAARTEIDLDDDNEEELFNWYISSENFIETLFDDSDELHIDMFIGKNDEDLVFVHEYDYDILPNDIVKRIEKAKQLSKYSVECFIDSFKEIIEKSFYRIEGFNHYQEKDYQLLFELYARSFNAVSLEFDKVYREVEVGNGRVDFILNFPFVGDVLFEIKMNRKDDVQHAILHQVPEYLARLKQNKAFLVIFSDIEDNQEYLELCKKIYKEKNVSIYPYFIKICGTYNPSKAK